MSEGATVKLSELDWRALVGSALVALFLFATVVPGARMLSEVTRQPEQEISNSGTKSAKEHIGPVSADDRLADYTALLAWFTGALVVVSAIQGFFLLRADKTARITAEAAMKSAEAAKLSSEAMPAIERPYMLIEWVQPRISEPEAVRTGQMNPTSVLLSFRNYGRTPANLAKARFYCRVLDHDPGPEDEVREVPEIPEDKEGPPTFEVEVYWGPNKEWRPEIFCTDPISDRTMGKLMTRQASIYIWGYLHYRDIFGETRETHICRRVDVPAGKAELVGTGMERNYAT